MELSDIKGVGDKTVQKLNKLDIFTVDDLVNYLPSHYIDLSHYDNIEDVEEGNYALLKVTITNVGRVTRKKNLHFFNARGLSNDIKISFVWFNQVYYHDQLVGGEEYTMWGKLMLDKYGGYEMVNPNFEMSDNVKKLTGIVPIYRTRGLIANTTLSNILKNTVIQYEPYSFIDSVTEKRYHLPNMRSVYYGVHAPRSMSEAVIAQDRLAIEDCANKIVAYRKINASDSTSKAMKFTQDASIISYILDILPFTLSPSQVSSIDEILSDMKSEKHMNRILLGDVGSGKTVVAFVTMYYAVRCGCQCAMMAPTEILSVQHYNGAKAIFDRLGVRVELLNASTPTKERRTIIAKLNNGDIDIIIGTHSLLGEDIMFDNLGYVVIDELHKFGVKQKGKLEDKMRDIDSLVMSATPIPRSVALIYYGDLKVSKLDKRYRTDTIKTYTLGDARLDGMYKYIVDNVNRGKQAYIVCPLVEDADGNEMFSAKKLYAELTQGALKDVRVGLVYGKMKESEKSRVMIDFGNSDIDVLIATTVIEVGIDVKNANIMLILNANKFGLATLHQLRGRIGRDGSRAECFMHTSNNAGLDRLNVMKMYNDGYDIAEADLDKRGCGDYLGISQSGGNKYTFMINKRIISLSKTIVDDILSEHNIYEINSPKIDALLDELTNITIN